MNAKMTCGSAKMAMGDIIGNCDLCNDLMAENARLRAELGKIADQLQWVNDERGRLEAEIEWLRAALQPFADLCTRLSRAHLNGGPDDEEVFVKIGLLRQAYRAFEEKI